MERYNRHIILSEVGPSGQQKLSNAKVLVIGAGGLGCALLQYLAAAGIGTLGIVDFDEVEESNLQRQVLFGVSSIGKYKALAAKERLEDLNPVIKINAYPEMLNPQNALKLFSDYDIIVDGTDNFDSRYLINDAAILTGKPMVYGAIYKFEGQVTVFNYNLGPSYRCLFPDRPKEGSAPNCSEIGVLGVLPGIIGTMQANEVLKIILNLGDVLSGKLLCYDAKTGITQILKIKRSDAQIENVEKNRETFESSSFNFNCNTSDIEIEAEQLSKFEKFHFIDVRAYYETPKLNLQNLIQIPLGELFERHSEIPKNHTCVVYCQSGIRSKKAVEFLRDINFKNVYSLKEGVRALMHLNIEI